MNIKNEIINLSKKHNIDLIGIVNKDIYNSFLPYFEKYYLKGYNTPFSPKKSNGFFNVEKIFKETKSIISFGISYNFFYDEGLNKNEALIARVARGEDYHIYLKEIASSFMEEVNSKITKVNYKICVDTSPISDKICAYSAGLGFIGKNSLIINPKLGSFLYLGSILVDISLKEDFPMKEKNYCKNCNRCINACLPNAINDLGINGNKCVSYITQKGINKEETFGYIYGCDMCQLACPYNKNNFSTHTKLKAENYKINLDNEINLTKEGFNEKYKHSSLRWIGYDKYINNIKKLKEK